MSMITEYVRLRPHELEHLMRLIAEDQDEAYEYAGDLSMGDLDEETSSRGTDLDKAWAALQHLLNRAGAPIDVIGGGAPITDDEWGYDSPRLLSVDDVAHAARFLDTTPFQNLASHYDARELTAARVYPQIWDHDDALQYLEGHYESLVELFHAAAADREPILVWMS
jgi:hypothetical protein